MSKHSDLNSALLEATDDLPELEADHVMLLEDDGEPVGWDDVSVEAPEEPAVAEGVRMPPERVRFCAPVLVQTEAGDRVAEGTVVNLSVQGIAAVAPIEVSAGERIWASFRLGLGQEPTTLLAEVVWRRSAGANQTAFGLEFKDVARDESQRIDEVVRERAEGRAGEWPLPVMPTGDVAMPRGRNPWVSAAAGMAAGIALALVVSAIPRSGVHASPSPAVEPALAATSVEENEPALQIDPSAEPAVAAAEPIAEAMPAQAPLVEPDLEAVAAPAEPAPVAAVNPSAPAAAMPESAPVAAMPEPAPAAAMPKPAPAAAVTKPARVAVALPPESLPRRDESAYSQDLQYLRPTGAADTMSLALLADGPVGQHVAFWLSSPRRLVVDVQGRKSGFAKSVYGIEHPLASRLRVGQHGDRVRFVIETAAAVQADYETKANGAALVITLHAAPQLTLK